MKNHKQFLQRFREDIQLRGLASKTLESYTLHLRIFLKYCNLPVEELGVEDIRRFLQHLIHERNCSPATVNTYGAAVRFFFAVTLNRTLNYLQIPRQKERKALPVVLSREEVASLLANCDNLKHKAMLMLAYSSGLRIGEIASLKIRHIDSKAMRVFVECGKGGKDRFTLLSEGCLFVLRDYWKAYLARPQSKTWNPSGWLFPGDDGVTPITTSAIRHAFNKALGRTAITKDASTHTLRHAFATHLLEDGVGLLQIKELLGHASIESTTIYLHLANTTSGVKSPLDLLPTTTFASVTAHG